MRWWGVSKASPCVGHGRGGELAFTSWRMFPVATVYWFPEVVAPAKALQHSCWNRRQIRYAAGLIRVVAVGIAQARAEQRRAMAIAFSAGNLSMVLPITRRWEDGGG